jgi:hypothetical protein
MVTTTVCPTMRYPPLTNSWEKRLDSSSPTSVAPFSLAALLALASSEEGAYRRVQFVGLRHYLLPLPL